MSAPDLTDDELDQRLRSAAAALAGLAPAGRIDELALRVDAELAQLDLSPVSPQPAVSKPLESRMTSDTDEKSGPAHVTPPSGRTEDSGLHDIKALAQDTRRRISRRITSQHDIDPDLLASSTGSMRMIALPEPAMVVALPEAPSTMEDVREAMKDPAMAAAAAAVPIQRKRTTLWVGLGAAAVAAAAAAVLLSGGGGSKKSTSSDQVAAAGTAAGPTVEPMAVAAPGAGSAMTVAAADPSTGAAAGSAVPPPPTAPETAALPSGGAGGAVAVTPPSGAGGGGAATGSAKSTDKVRGGSGDPKTTAGDAKPSGGSAKPGGDAKVTTGGTKPAGGAAAGGAAAAGNKGEKSIEDLLNDASGGSTKPKDTGGGGGGGGGGDAPAGPTKTALEPKEIKAGMSAVAGAAQSCFGKHGVAGHVKVKATVAPSGSVSKVDATGEFAGTPTGACVAGAVKGASFPSWTGAPMTVTYSFTLQE